MTITSLKQGWEMQLTVLENTTEDYACPNCFEVESSCTCTPNKVTSGMNQMWPTNQVIIKLKKLIG